MANTRGKPEAFTDRENRAMRAILRGQYEHLRKIGKIKNQTQMGKLLGVGQQTAGKLLGPSAHGLSRPTALKLAELCGFDSPESLLKNLGALADPTQAPPDWPQRDLAFRAAINMGYDEEVIDRVQARFTEDRYKQLAARWWMDQVVREQAARDAEREVPPPPSAPSPVVHETSAPPSPAPRRRKTG